MRHTGRDGETDREAVGDTHTAGDGKRGLRRERQGVRDREMNTEVQRQGDAEKQRDRERWRQNDRGRLRPTETDRERQESF